jgi:hypothetical protein
MPFQKADFRDMVLDEQSGVSSARIGMWATSLLIFALVIIDSVLAIQQSKISIPAAPYAILSTMFLGFVSWAAGPRIAQYLGPQIGQVASGIAQAVQSWGREDLTPEEKDARRDQNRIEDD